MENLYYIFGVIVVGLLCMLAIRLSAGSNESQSNRLRSKSRASGNERSVADPNIRKVLKREFRKVPTPWGWPRYSQLNDSQARPDLSKAMQSFTRRLVEQKQLVNGTSVDPRVSGSIRALLEDRYASAAKSIEYRKVRAPLLRDPNEPYDQMDSFGTPGMKPDLKKLKRPAVLKTHSRPLVRAGRIQHMDLKDIKLPWGW